MAGPICDQLWRLADEQGLLSLASFERFIQVEIDYDNFVAGVSADQLADRRSLFEESLREEITTELRLLLLHLQEPVFTLQYAADAFLNGHLTAQQAIEAMHRPIWSYSQLLCSEKLN